MTSDTMTQLLIVLPRFAAVALALFASPLAAQIFLCTAEVAGQLSCQASRQCECRFFNENKMKGTPAGYRWDCNILRGGCGPEVPATIHPYYEPLPAAVSLDRETHGKFVLIICVGPRLTSMCPRAFFST